MKRNKIVVSLLSLLIVANSVFVGTVNASAATLDQSTTKEKNRAYVYNPELQIDLKVRLAPSLDGTVEGYLYNFENVQILDTINANGSAWDKIIYNNNIAYVSDAYIQHYVSPSDDVVNVAENISKQFEVGNSNQIAGNFDGQGLSLGYLQWCIGQGTLQPLLNRMDREYNSEMRSIFGSNYDSIHKMLLDNKENQLIWAKSINDSGNTIMQPWYSQFVNLCNNAHFINIESDAEAYKVGQAMLICNKYNLKTVRGFALAFDIAVQNGSISPEAAKIIDAALIQKPSMAEKDLLKVIANAVADTSVNISEDIRLRKMTIVNGNGTVHGFILDLDKNYGLSDSTWR
ncbi:SH3 domain-containing protein [Clostridium sp.]|uniref:SH3 domain-containing protein n=1 Tax=Clostridium sp. TaxID=1506 RepID=UPI00261EB8FC|nr:SH3 domain-containing protein [Clostridium sp.]